MSTPSAATCDLDEPHEDEILFRVENVQMFLNTEADGWKTLFITNQYIAHIDDEGGIRVNYPAILDCIVSTDPSINPLPCVHVLVDVSKGPETVSENLKKYVQYKNRKEATSDNPSGPSYDYSDFPGYVNGGTEESLVEIKFIPDDHLAADSIYGLISEHMMYYPAGHAHNQHDEEIPVPDDDLEAFVQPPQ